MEKEGRIIFIVPDESYKIGQGEGSLDAKNRRLSVQDKISAIAAGTYGLHHFPNSEIWYIGRSRETAQNMRDYTHARFPDLDGRIRVFDGEKDTYSQMESLANAAKSIDNMKYQVRTIAPFEHRKRVNDQLERNGIEVEKSYESNVAYINGPREVSSDKDGKLDRLVFGNQGRSITRSSRNRRIRVVRDEYFDSKKLPSRIADTVRESLLNLYNLVDRKGRLIRKLPEYGGEEKEAEVYSADETTQSSPK